MLFCTKKFFLLIRTEKLLIDFIASSSYRVNNTDIGPTDVCIIITDILMSA